MELCGGRAAPRLLQLFVAAPGAVMSGFDDPGIFYSDSFGGDGAADEGKARKSQLQRRFKEFLRQYRVGTDRTGFTFKYRCGPERGGEAPRQTPLPEPWENGRRVKEPVRPEDWSRRGSSDPHPVGGSFVCFIPEGNFWGASC